jgi:hypothetical protein
MPGIAVVPDIPTVPGVPMIVEVPGQGTAVTLGVVRGVVGLSPALPSSVAPRGIAPLIVDPAVNPVLVDPALIAPMPVDDPAILSGLPAVVELQPVEVIEFDTEPPPSNVGIDPDIPVLVVPALIHGVVLIMGLSPPVLSSVAPSGIPLPCDGALEDVAPRGDVAPMPGTGATCAKLGPPLKIIRLAAMAKTRRIGPPLVSRTAIDVCCLCDRSVDRAVGIYATLR